MYKENLFPSTIYVSFFMNQAWLQQWTFPEQREDLAHGFGYRLENNEEIQH